MKCFLRHKMLRTDGWSEDNQKLMIYLDVLLEPKPLLHLKLNVSISVSVQDWPEKTVEVIDCRTSGENSIVGF